MKISKKIENAEQAFIEACKELGLDPKKLPIVDGLPEKDGKSIIAYYKLTIITRALNDGWEADFSNHNQWKYWNYLWVDIAGFVYSHANAAATSATAYVGSRLCFKERGLAEFAIENYKPLYEEYLLMK